MERRSVRVDNVKKKEIERDNLGRDPPHGCLCINPSIIPPREADPTQNSLSNGKTLTFQVTGSFHSRNAQYKLPSSYGIIRSSEDEVSFLFLIGNEIPLVWKMRILSIVITP